VSCIRIGQIVSGVSLDHGLVPRVVVKWSVRVMMLLLNVVVVVTDMRA
jgi:hypothetical protein